LKKLLAEIALRNRRAKMPYKRRSPTAYTFLVTNSRSVFRKTDFFNSHKTITQVIGIAAVHRRSVSHPFAKSRRKDGAPSGKKRRETHRLF
jgi:hypothetical protein